MVKCEDCGDTIEKDDAGIQCYSCSLDTKEKLIVWGVLASVLAIIFLVCLVNALSQRDELGHAICKEEYGRNYVNYYQQTLYCKDTEIKEKNYDGIKIQTDDTKNE